MSHSAGGEASLGGSQCGSQGRDGVLAGNCESCPHLDCGQSRRTDCYRADIFVFLFTLRSMHVSAHLVPVSLGERGRKMKEEGHTGEIFWQWGNLVWLDWGARAVAWGDKAGEA